MRKDLFNELLASVIEAKKLARERQNSLAATRALAIRQKKWRALRAAGWRVGSAEEFLKLSDVDIAMLDIYFALGRSLKLRRGNSRLSRAALAKVMGVKEPLVERMEKGDPTVPLQTLVRALLLLGASPRKVGVAFGRGPAKVPKV